MTAPATGLRLLAVLAWSTQPLPVLAVLLSWACSSAFDGAHGVWVVCGCGCALHVCLGCFLTFTGRGNALQLFGPLATLHTIASAVLTKHVRNMLLSSGAFAVLARLLIRVRVLRRCGL